MTEYSPEDFARANRINARLATDRDSALIQEGKALAEKMLGYVRSKIEKFEDFEKRVQLSEEFPLHESKQMEKEEKALKLVYLRGKTLLETIREAESRP